MYTQEPPSTAHEPTGAQQPGLDTTSASPRTAFGPSLATDWRGTLQPWWRATLVVLPIFVLTRCIFLLLSYFGGVLFFVPNYWPGHLSFHSVLYAWYRWDAVRFATIAAHGYPSLEYAAFFPLYPYLERVLSFLFGGDIVITGMVISNAALLGGLLVLYRLVETEFDSATARRSALYLSIFPSALFFFAAYNESLFLLFMLLCFYTLRRRLWWIAGLFGGIAAFTRSIGIFLAVIFLYEFARLQLPLLQQAVREREQVRIIRLLASLPAILLIPLGLALYAFILNRRFHDPLAFTHAQVFWRVGLSFPWTGPAIALKSILTLSPFTFAVPHDIIDLGAFLLFLALLVLCFVGPERFARHQWSFALFGLLALVYSVLFPGTPGPGGIPYDPLPSMQRFVLEMFAGFIVLARFGRRPWVHEIYLLLALPLLAFLTLQFLTGHWTV